MSTKQYIDTLTSARNWLYTNPPDGTNRSLRREKMTIIQHAADLLPVRKYMKYMRAWSASDSLCDHFEKNHPILNHLRAATVHALEEFQSIKVKKGVAVWHLYNMGYIFKTPSTCFGIDLHFRGAEVLADSLDFLLITHGHHDHYAKPLMDALIKAGKPVITRWYKGSTVVKKPEKFSFGTTTVKVSIGDHHRHLPLLSTNNMLMFQIECDSSANNCVIYHTGDGNGIKKMNPDKPVDILITHVQLPMPLSRAIKKVKPKITFPSHILELSHTKGFPVPMRWSYEYAFEKIALFPEKECCVLIWGERWLTPGTEIDSAASE